MRDEEEDGMGFSGLVPTRAEKHAERATNMAIASAVLSERERCARAVIDYSLSFSFDESIRDLFAECSEFVRTGRLAEDACADARLIAAAPAMLGALRMVGMLRQLGGMLPGSREVVQTIVDAADEAIAKAEGK